MLIILLFVFFKRYSIKFEPTNPQPPVTTINSSFYIFEYLFKKSLKVKSNPFDKLVLDFQP
jgi:hypothetical protein